MIRQLVSVAVAVLLVVVGFIGTYEPMLKSQLFGEAEQMLPAIHSPAEFAALFTPALDAPSPIGQVEQVHDVALIVLKQIQLESTPPEVVSELVNFVDDRFAAILPDGKGFKFVHTMYDVGLCNVIAYARTGQSAYLKVAGNLFSAGLKASPGRPEFLKGLFGVYLSGGDTEKVKATAEQILALWPDDQNTREALARYLAPQPGQ